MTPRTPLLIITGPPASGKTALARRLAADLRLPLISRDDLKERLFDILGWDDRAWSRQVGAASYELLWQAVEAQLAAGRSAIVESNFRGPQTLARFRALAARYPLAPIQIACTADAETLLARHRQRTASGERHPGHVDHLNDDELRATLAAGDYAQFDIGGDVLALDTTDFAALDYPALVAALRAALDRAAGDSPGAPPHLAALDHLVLTVRDLPAARDWYVRVLGMAPVVFQDGRTALAFGRQKINLHQAGREFEPKAARPTPGSADLCFLTDTPLAAFLAHLAARGVPVELGPVPRTGAQGPLSSLYLRDPDGNLIEIANPADGEEGAASPGGRP